MNFIPDTDNETFEIPFLDDARSDDGWQGHSTNESIGSLRAQITAEIGRLGGTVIRWMRGTYHIQNQERPGVQIVYQIVKQNNAFFEGRIDIAGLPWRPPYGGKKSHGGYKDAVEKKKEKSLAMALYNVREALKAMRIMQTLSPGYAALVPWLLAGDSGKTIGELWGSGSIALPSSIDNPDGAIEGKFTEVSE